MPEVKDLKIICESELITPIEKMTVQELLALRKRINDRLKEMTIVVA